MTATISRRRSRRHRHRRLSCFVGSSGVPRRRRGSPDGGTRTRSCSLSSTVLPAFPHLFEPRGESPVGGNVVR